MKRISMVILLMMTIVSVWSQSTKPKTPVKTASAAPAKPVLKNFNDSVSYCLGYAAANMYKPQSLDKYSTNFNGPLLANGMNDAFAGKPSIVDDYSASQVMNKWMNAMMESKAKPNIDSGAAFLARNKKRPGVITTASGLQYEVITQGTGIRPTAEDTFVVHYRGTLLNGTEFDGSYNRNQPLEYPMTRVIRGWTEGLQLMAIGSKYKFYIPYNLAYGSSDNGPIPGGSTLVFEIEMLGVKKGSAPVK